MVSNPRKPWQRLAFAALLLLALPVLADVAPVPIIPYSAIASGATAAAACAAAVAKVDDHCAFHGTITTTTALCVRPYDPDTGRSGPLMCFCTASTANCNIFGGPHLP